MKGCIPAIFLVILTALLVGSVLAFEAYHAERIYPGVWVWGHDLSGLRRLYEKVVEHDLPVLIHHLFIERKKLRVIQSPAILAG